MNNKYFGNSLDLFKYDVLEYIVKKNNLKLHYVPMLTEPELRKLDPKYKLYEIGVKNNNLLNFMKKVVEKKLDFNEIVNYFSFSKIDFEIILDKKYNSEKVEFINGIKYFSDENRDLYFKTALTKLNHNQRNFVFIDPDVGIDLGVKRRVRSMRKMYVTTDEITAFKKAVMKTIFYVFFNI